MLISQFQEKFENQERVNLSAGSKIDEYHKSLLLEIVEEHSALPTPKVLQRYWKKHGELEIGLRQVNRLRSQWGLSFRKGRPLESPATDDSKKTGMVRLSPTLIGVGVGLFDIWLNESHLMVSVIKVIRERIRFYLQEHPKDDFPLLHHKISTLENYFKALLYAPLFQIKRLTQYDRQETGLISILGKDYRSSTLNQFLSQLERFDISAFLMPMLAEGEIGETCYIDGHMIPFWSSRKMHKGKITMLGRIMSGSNAVVSHDENGHALFVQYYSPDIHLTEVIIEYCQQIVESTGITMFVIDREVNSLKIAQDFDKRGWGLLSMLDQNQYQGVEDWELTSEGLLGKFPVYSGYWKDSKKRAEDGRWFVVVQLEERILPYWGNSKIKEYYQALDCPVLYSQRTEIQENQFKCMIAHGALNVNYGTKVIISVDRHQQRKIKILNEKQEKLNERLEKKEIQLEEQKKK